MYGEGFFGWVMAGVAAIVATLSSAVAFLYKSQVGDLRQQLTENREAAKMAISEHKSELTRLDVVEHELRKEIAECKSDREELRVCLAKIQTEQRLLSERLVKVEQQQ
jgi:septal ring factor EnvC (AmiA/AmiB activator)